MRQLARKQDTVLKERIEQVGAAAQLCIKERYLLQDKEVLRAYAL